jgi:hypothetical protein
MNIEKFIEPSNLLSLENEITNEHVPIPNPSKLNFVESKTNSIYHYYVQPFSGHSNGCGQSAMATLLTYWNYMNYNPTNAENLYVNPSSNPDIFGGLLGTSWERFRQVLENYGMTAHGQNEPSLTVNSANGKYETLCNWVNANCPVAVILGNGELNLGSGAHWGIVVRITSYDVTLANYGDGFMKVNLSDFMKSWEAYWLPGVHYAGVFAQPR